MGRSVGWVGCLRFAGTEEKKWGLGRRKNAEGAGVRNPLPPGAVIYHAAPVWRWAGKAVSLKLRVLQR